MGVSISSQAMLDFSRAKHGTCLTPNRFKQEREIWFPHLLIELYGQLRMRESKSLEFGVADPEILNDGNVEPFQSDGG